MGANSPIKVCATQIGVAFKPFWCRKIFQFVPFWPKKIGNFKVVFWKSGYIRVLRSGLHNLVNKFEEYHPMGEKVA